MDTGWIARGMLAMTLACGVVAGMVRADEPPLLHSPMPVPPGAVAPGPVPAIVPAPLGGPLPPVGSTGGKVPGTLHNMIRRPIGCMSDHWTLGCSSLRSTLTFIFGSCRVWYGEACVKTPAPIPGLPDHLQPGNGNGAACRCQ